MFSENLNRIVGAIALMFVFACGLAVGLYFYYFTPEYSRVGYQPFQEISFSHKTHSGELKIDCRYCHYLVEESWYAGMPEASICMNCHNQALTRDERLETVKRSASEGLKIQYTRAHRLADYVWFSHSVHTRRGIGCVNCHGEVQTMERTYQAKSLSMKFCINCHRNPAPWLVPLDKVVNISQTGSYTNLAKNWNIRSSDECSQCHR